MLRERLQSFPVSLLGYCITSNHVHMLLVSSGGRSALWRFMQSLAGDFAHAYNLRKKRSGAYWGDRYHAVMVDSGVYLWRCLQYIDLNMVRCGVIAHTSEWDFCGYNELIGAKRRNSLIDVKMLARLLGADYPREQIASAYADAIAARLESGDLQRDAIWTEALAVGAKEFAARMSHQIPHRMQITVEPTTPQGNSWIVKEFSLAYVAENAARNHSISANFLAPAPLSH
jgi:putative transposase